MFLLENKTHNDKRKPRHAWVFLCGWMLEMERMQERHDCRNGADAGKARLQEWSGCWKGTTAGMEQL
jgi:hypothetical protein